MKIALYAHGGSGNHGCEALVRSAIETLGPGNEHLLLSEKPEEDKYYGLDEVATIADACMPIPKGLQGLMRRVKSKFIGGDRAYYESLYREVPRIVKDCDIAIAIGGDNYCYKGFLERFGVMNHQIHRAGVPTVLLGCSIEPTLMTPGLIDDLRGYSLITARESITYEALKAKGLSHVKLCADSAFALPMLDIERNPLFQPGNTVGVNVSPMIISHEPQQGITMLNFENMIRHILENTDMAVALIPHVVWNSNDDRIPLKALFDKFKHTGRIFLQADCEARQIKSVISQCRFMVAARTHASIAAYSTGVPTLVVGYSVKARGIAKDLFGTEKNYVVPVESLKSPTDLCNAFIWLQENEKTILSHYQKKLSDYIYQVQNLSLCITNVK